MVKVFLLKSFCSNTRASHVAGGTKTPLLVLAGSGFASKSPSPPASCLAAESMGWTTLCFCHFSVTFKPALKKCEGQGPFDSGVNCSTEFTQWPFFCKLNKVSGICQGTLRIWSLIRMIHWHLCSVLTFLVPADNLRELIKGKPLTQIMAKLLVKAAIFGTLWLTSRNLPEVRYILLLCIPQGKTKITAHCIPLQVFKKCCQKALKEKVSHLKPQCREETIQAICTLVLAIYSALQMINSISKVLINNFLHCFALKLL